MEFYLIILCLLLVAYFAGTETAFLSVNKVRLAGFLRRQLWGAQAAHRFLEKPSRFVLTTLVGTNLAAITFSSLLTAYLSQYDVPSGWILAISTLSVLIIGEIIPKSLARDLADQAVLWTSPALVFFQILFFPVIRICSLSAALLLKLFGISRTEVRLFFTRRDLEILIREGVKTGSLKARHESLLSRVFQLPALRARDVMTPRTEIVALETTASLDDLRRVILKSGFSKIPVYHKDLDHIVGVAYAHDLFDNPPDLAALVKPIPFLPDQKRAVDVFRDLRRAHQTIAIVVDEWGGTAGLVTHEDVIEELTGDIEDEYDRKRKRIRELSHGRWLVSGRTELDELQERLDLLIPEGDYATLGGYLIHELGRIPKTGEIFDLGGVEYKIAKASQNRINAVVVKVIAENEKGANGA